jgi:hypothetical protein
VHERPQRAEVHHPPPVRITARCLLASLSSRVRYGSFSCAQRERGPPNVPPRARRPRYAACAQLQARE